MAGFRRDGHIFGIKELFSRSTKTHNNTLCIAMEHEGNTF